MAPSVLNAAALQRFGSFLDVEVHVEVRLKWIFTERIRHRSEQSNDVEESKSCG